MLSILSKPLSLQALARWHRTDKGPRSHNFAPFYDKHLSCLRHEPIKMLEIGVGRGRSLRMWRNYFTKARIVGADVEPKDQFKGRGYEIRKCDQSKRESLVTLLEDLGPQDIIIDDGSHHVGHQQITLGAIFRYLKPGGYYILEDLHTSFFFDEPEFGLLEDGSNSTVKMLEQFQKTNRIESRYLNEEEKDYLERTIQSIEFYHFSQREKHLTSLLRKIF